MRLVDDSKLDLEVLKAAIERPALHAKSTHRFWDDEHISAQMLKFHLNPDVEAASKKKETIEAETSFIIKETKMDGGKTVLDLGCGPGLYVREFAKTGARVTGVDISDRSLRYAEENIKPLYSNVCFQKMNYLELDAADAFDIVTLIFYDFCALSTEDQKSLLSRVHRALKKGGVFLLDVVTDKRKIQEKTTIGVHDNGFWSPDPYLEIYNSFIYTDPLFEGNQHTIIDTEGNVRVIRIYHRLFTPDEITDLLEKAGFVVRKMLNNLRGDRLTENTETLGIVAGKP